MTVIMYYDSAERVSTSREGATKKAHLGSLELPEGDIDRDSSLSLSLEFVEDPGVLEGS